MKRLFLTALALALLVAFAPTQAQAGCVTFTNFCDGLEIKQNFDDIIHGLWKNFDCVGSDHQVLGNDENGQATVVGDPLGPPLDFVFVLDRDTKTFDLWAFDGVTPPFQIQFDQPFTFDSAACSFLGREDLPASNDIDAARRAAQKQ